MLNGQRLGKYQLVELVKSGGMATVYRAKDLDTGRVVAIKVLSQILATDPGYVARFKNEVTQVRKLAHPNIVPIEYFGVEGPYTYFVMPLFKASLRDVLMRYKRVAPDSALNIAIQIAAALTAVHSIGLIHRDIKPDNILLSDDRALLTDFGIVRQIEFAGLGQPPTLAGSGLPIGTPQYMAPEQLANQPVDQRADLYALGAVLYEMLTGRSPHTGDTPYSIASRALNDRIQPPATLHPAIPAEVDAVVMRALARNPRDRYANAANMRAALQSVSEQVRRDMTTSRGWPDGNERKAAPLQAPYPPAPGAAGGASAASNFPPRSAMEPAPPVAVPRSAQRGANDGARGDRSQDGGYGNGHGSDGGDENNNRPARDDGRRRIPQPLLLGALVAALFLIALFSGLNLAISLVSHGDNRPLATATLTYESLAATATAVAQIPPRPPPPPPGPPVRVTPTTASYPCNGSVDTTLTLINDGRDPFTWTAAPVGPNGAGVKLDVSNGALAPGAATPVRVTGTPAGSSFVVKFISDGGNPTVEFTCA
jgi:serine/threonine protein kinase